VWSRDPKMLAGLPDNGTAARNWEALREGLLSANFVQTTLTNFERAAFRDHPDRFVYEEYSFRANRYDMIGFGPGAISFAAAPDYQSGWKILNPEGAKAYQTAVERNATCPWDRHFDYDDADMVVFHLTRRLAALSIDEHEQKQLFGIPARDEFGDEIAVMERAGLLESDKQTWRPTPYGMFYADAMASVFADRRSLSREIREFFDPRNQSNARGYM
jgi:coproporphyrinogen III oxidase-like Fe-S oxidoreductase